jgi:hypothetical protein
VEHLQQFLDLAAAAPQECDAGHFRIWQKMSLQLQREIRSLAARNFFADERRPAANLDLAYTMVVYWSCQPFYGRRPLEFTYDIGDVVTLSTVLRLIGRGMQVRLKAISQGIQSDQRLKRRFLPVWYLDILKAVKQKPRTFIEMLAREAIMISSLIELGATGSERTARRFVKNTESLGRILGLDSTFLQDLVLRTGIEHLSHGRILKDRDKAAPGSPDARIGGDKNGNHGNTHSGRQVTNPGIVSDIQACG